MDINILKFENYFSNYADFEEGGKTLLTPHLDSNDLIAVLV